MSRRSKRTDERSDKAEPRAGNADRRQPQRRGRAPLPEVLFTRRPASAASAVTHAEPAPPLPTPESHVETAPSGSRRVARIVGAPSSVDDTELERRHLLSKLLESEGPAAVTRAANAYRKGGFQFPEEQAVQLKLLEHGDEAEVCTALDVLTALLDQQSPIQLPVFEQRLKRLEDGAEDAETRARAAALRRVLRT